MENDFSGIFEQMKMHGMKVQTPKVLIQVHDAKTVLRNALTYFLGLEGKQLIWLHQYDAVAEWLENNEGRGLFLYGTSGLGKTFLTRYVISAILLKYCNKVVSSYDMVEANKDPEKVLQKHIIALDDIGTEEISVKYGEKRSVVPEILDSVEKYGKLILLTSNLGAEQLVQKYGTRTMDRIIGTTKRIEFTGRSFR
jgi:DNA replication protein DnaC